MKKETEKISKSDIPQKDLKLFCKEYRISKKFVVVLSIVSILGFVGIISENVFNINIENTIEAIWFMIMGVGFIMESNPSRLFKKIENSMDQRNFTSMTTLVVGALALASGILKLMGVDNITFSAIEAFISIIAILFIMIETWVIK